ncbi:hypothetical protein H4R18_004973 [Coemansia javaensis]|uniref:HD/PDEase domain-containing protein n=1 Tax=Coemansia javaensis TaxID=2761396 RepID=A0A9W8H2W1_9FUNG|nr:hypothetical protein H4R18_004973 [Coemansia javaensis]
MRGMLRRGLTDLDGLDAAAAAAADYDGSKYVNDPIHGYISLTEDMVQCIDTPQFQRLRHLKQLGTGYFVFPGASHNRFEHCIGTAYLANRVVRGLAERQPELDVSERDVRCVTLAGLCHDLGHGPFSHVFDNQFIRRACPGAAWSHEHGSEMMLDYMIDSNHIEIDEADVRFIRQLIHGSMTPVAGEKMFLFDIVANKRNGVDVDKFDYIQRDCYNVGVRSSYDFSRLMLNSRVIGDEICYSHKEAFNLAEMFHTRYSLHKRVYGHHAAKAIDFMIVDALLAADPVLRISEAIRDPRLYQSLTDEVIRDIERSTEPEMAAARGIVARIRTRDIYKFVDEFILPPEVAQSAHTAISAAEIVGHRADNDDFGEADVLVDISRIHYGMKQENPVDHISFYSKYNAGEKFPIASEFVSLCVPAKYEERILRIFTRTPAKRGQIQRAARRLIARFSGANIVAAGGTQTPAAQATPAGTPPSLTPHRGLTLPGDPATPADVKRRRLRFDGR